MERTRSQENKKTRESKLIRFDEKNDYHHLTLEAFLDMQALQLVAAGWKRVEEKVDSETGEYRARYTVPEGDYLITTGFMPVDKEEKRWPNMDSSRSMILDTQSREYQEIKTEFKRLLWGRAVELKDPTKRFAILGEALQALMEAELTYDDGKDKTRRRLSKIIRSGTAYCAEKSLISGLLLEELFASDPEQWEGCYATVIDGLDEPIGKDFDGEYHTWLRVSDGRYVMLLDTEQEEQATYDLQNVEVYKDDPFIQYCLEMDFVSQIPADGSWLRAGGTQNRVQEITDTVGDKKIWQPHTYALRSMLQGYVEIPLHLNATTVELVNGKLEYVHESDDRLPSPRELHPLLEIQRI